jgi:hypothetical protein
MARRKAFRKGVWYQIGGDMDAASYGALLVRFDDYGADLYRIEPVRDLVGRDTVDVGHSYWSAEGYYDFDDLGVPSGDHQAAVEAIYDMQGDGALTWDYEYAGWSQDVLAPLGVPASKVKWWAKQGHGFRQEDAEVRAMIAEESRY